MRKTKIIGTIGPASENPDVFRMMCLQGLNVARLNFSHGTHEEHQKKIDMIKAVREEMDLPIAIMLDTKGPEFRIGTFKNNKIMLEDPTTETTFKNLVQATCDRLNNDYPRCKTIGIYTYQKGSYITVAELPYTSESCDILSISITPAKREYGYLDMLQELKEATNGK